MNAPKMRSKVVSAIVRLPRRRSRPLSVSFCQEAAKRESSISAGLSPVAPNAPNHDSSTTVGRRAGRGRAGALASERGAVLICARKKASSSSSDEKATAAARALVPLDQEPKVVVFMPGDHAPSFLASAKPLRGDGAAAV